MASRQDTVDDMAANAYGRLMAQASKDGKLADAEEEYENLCRDCSLYIY